LNTVKEKGERLKTIPPFLWFKKSIQKPQGWRTLEIMPRILRKIEFGFSSYNAIFKYIASRVQYVLRIEYKK
jgi:hypothetical protein